MVRHCSGTMISRNQSYLGIFIVIEAVLAIVFSWRLMVVEPKILKLCQTKDPIVISVELVEILIGEGTEFVSERSQS